MKKDKVLSLRAMQTAGATISEIATKLRLNPEDVESKIIELGYTPNEKVTPEPHGWGKNDEEPEAPQLNKNHNYMTQDEIDNALLMYENGMGVSEIARQLGRAQSSISRLIAKHNGYIRKPKDKEKEPASAPTETSSNDNKNISTNNYNALKNSCQVAFEYADQSCKDILGIYENMTDAEQKAFDLGSVYLSTLYARNNLEEALMGREKE
ncbi:MAG: helix-turn-helix domain-containing protein [Oscillospiraceae bacterium]|nr:helix-turn-helix domain-containing protein [Oscillospiraceae bacterium]MBQ8377575.1 helix-turn-helix domain-containing protein [Oscillospiraceae bacterium]MBQ8884118.1 helix-turn-helix domain-containing protein [Oscillospiraceae bacterium]